MAEQLREPLVLRSLSNRGYLKLPKEFSNRYNFTAKSLPDPDAWTEVVGDKIRLYYEWDAGTLKPRNNEE